MKIKIFLVLLLSAFLLNFSSVEAKKPVICYWGTWSHYRQGDGQFRVENIDPTLCTHIMYSFFGIGSDGEVKILDSWLDIDLKNIEKTVGLKRQNPGLKVLASFGGWNAGSQTFSEVAKRADLRENFAKNCLKFAQKYGFDGIDIDWEYPGDRGGDPAVDKENFSLMLKTLRKYLKPQGKLLTIATAADSSKAANAYNLPVIVNYLDFVLVMTYDYHGLWDHQTGVNSPLYKRSADKNPAFNIEATLKYYLSNGVPASKLGIGIPLYGRTFALANSGDNGIGATAYGGGEPGPYTQTSGFLGFHEFCEKSKQSAWNRQWDDASKTPYAYKGNQWISYDDVDSVKAKVNYAWSLNLGAVMVWSIETEDFHGKCGQGVYPLLKAINAKWGEESDISEDEGSEEKSDEESEEESVDGKLSCNKSGIQKHPFDCNKFFMCSKPQGEPMVFNCPSNLYFNENINACDWPENVKCFEVDFISLIQLTFNFGRLNAFGAKNASKFTYNPNGKFKNYFYKF